MPSWKKVILSGSDASLNSLNVTTNVTATSFTGSLLGTASYATQALSASYAPGTSQTLQQVTDNGNSTTNAITASAFVAGNPSAATTSFVYNGAVATLSQIANQSSTLDIIQRQTTGSTLDAAMSFRRQGGPATWTAGLLGSDDSFTISRGLVLGSYDRFKLTNTGAEIISGSLYVENSITGSDVQINDWGSVSASLASIESGGTSTTLQQVSDIFSGKITNWKSVGGVDMPITLYGRENSSGRYINRNSDSKKRRIGRY